MFDIRHWNFRKNGSLFCQGQMHENRILQALSEDEFAVLKPRLLTVALEQHDILYDAGAPIEHVYFPLSGLVSLLSVTDGGDAVEVGIIGAEGVVGGVALLGTDESLCRVTVQIPGKALRLPTVQFLNACAAIPRLRHLVKSHIQIVLLQAQQNGACHALHTVEGRLCRWLLHAHDVTKSNVLVLTQGFLSHILGTQRTSVSVIANALQHAGFIRYRRGRIEIVDKMGLEDASCECYSLIKQKIDTLLPEIVKSERPAA